MVNATPRSLYPRETEPVPIVSEVGWAPGPGWTGAVNLSPTGIRSPDRPARSESLYRPSFRGPRFNDGVTQKLKRSLELFHCPALLKVTIWKLVKFLYFGKTVTKKFSILLGPLKDYSKISSWLFQ